MDLEVISLNEDQMEQGQDVGPTIVDHLIKAKIEPNSN